eukprot:Amastigsp_a843262_577.p5 type:complete len:127 gc:universal Amastigsp_a843262_577:121-501(+)
MLLVRASTTLSVREVKPWGVVSGIMIVPSSSTRRSWKPRARDVQSESMADGRIGVSTACSSIASCRMNHGLMNSRSKRLNALSSLTPTPSPRPSPTRIRRSCFWTCVCVRAKRSFPLCVLMKMSPP